MAKIGLNAKLYNGTDEITNVRDLSMPDEFGEADISTRGSVFEEVTTTQRKLSLEWQMLWDESDTAGFAAIWAAYKAGTTLTLKCLSSEDGQGPVGPFEIVKCSRNESLKDAVLADVVAKPAGDLTWEVPT